MTSLNPGSKRRKPKPSGELREKMEAFKAATLYGVCAGCGKAPWAMYGGYLRAHHVVYRQHLPAGYEWDPRNAMPLCDPCHERHHSRSRPIPFSALTEEHVGFAREVLGEFADDYLVRRYPKDPEYRNQAA